MSGFSAAWLTLREGYDLAARNRAVLGAVAGAFVEQTAISVVDLGCGTGSTLRAIADHLPPRQSWRLIDNDLGLLARAATVPRPPHVNVVTKPIDLVSDLELAIEGPLDLVTTSALLDLVSLEWLDRLVIEAAARQLPVYAALTYDGRVVLEPSEDLDPEVLACFHAHQRADKGFGPALGPTAAARAVERFEHFGYAVVQGRSDWVLKPADLAIQEALFAGWAESGALSAALSSDYFAAWLAQRRSHLAVGRSNLRVGHLDIFARPMGVR
jgi:SAM-dependent methyltransferase